ncbi:MAG: TRAP transporter small permease subunit [Candidatus Aureabacteria bacterium]|nr:TRAP transporter small permease subunit [Candidatus Auribacterota bacterium]
MQIIKIINRFLEIVEKSLLVVLFCIIIFLSFTQVILREFFSSGLLWADTFLRHLVLWIGFLGAAIAARNEKHFVIDIAKKLFPEKTRIVIEIVTSLFVLIALYYLSFSAVKFFKDDVAFSSVLFRIRDFEIPSYWMNVIIPAGFILLFIHFALNTLEKSFLLIRLLREKTEK